MSIRSFVFLLFFVVSTCVVGQENIHYSQFYNAPMMTNPAFCGQIGDDLFRLNGHAREQWSGINLAGGTGFLYSTKSFGIDLSLANKHLGLGLYNIIDKSGGGVYNTVKIMPTASYSFIMGDNALTLGGQYVYHLGQLDSKYLDFQVGGEQFIPSVSYSDFNAGINYKHDFYYIIANLGFSAGNLMRPKQQFLKSGLAEQAPLYFRTHFTVDWELTDKLKISPGFYLGYQAATTDILAGGNISYKYMEMGKNGNRLILGLWARTNNGNLQAIIPKFGVQLNKLQIMASYDYDISLSKAGSSDYFKKIPNTFEISIIFTGKPKIVPPLFEENFILNPRY